MGYSIFDKISEQYNVQIKPVRFKKQVPVVFSEDKKIFYINERFSLESQVFSIFHTLAHSQLETICEKSTSSEEMAAEITTYELLIPENEIKNYINDNLIKLKDIFPYCSFETIAKRLQLIKCNVLTIWHNFEIVFRKNLSGLSVNEKPDMFEIECMKYSYKNQCSIGRGNENRRIKCLSYFIKEESRKKVILFMERTS